MAPSHMEMTVNAKKERNPTPARPTSGTNAETAKLRNMNAVRTKEFSVISRAFSPEPQDVDFLNLSWEMIAKPRARTNINQLKARNLRTLSRSKVIFLEIAVSCICLIATGSGSSEKITEKQIDAPMVDTPMIPFENESHQRRTLSSLLSLF